MLNLQLPDVAVPDRVSIARPLQSNERYTYAGLDGPGVIRLLWVTLQHPRRMTQASRKAIIRIFFDESI